MALSSGLSVIARNHLPVIDGADWLRNELLDRGITPVIPSKSNRKFPAEFDKEAYKWRHLIESYFGKLKEGRGITMRSCETDPSFKAFISIGATLIHTRRTSTAPSRVLTNAPRHERNTRGSNKRSTRCPMPPGPGCLPFGERQSFGRTQDMCAVVGNVRNGLRLGSMMAKTKNVQQQDLTSDCCFVRGALHTRFYLAQAPAVQKAGIDPALHYLDTGWREGLDPSPGFSTAAYLEKNPDVAKSGINPLVHFLTYGASESRGAEPSRMMLDIDGFLPALYRLIHPYFDVAWYMRQVPENELPILQPIEHFLRSGMKRDFDPSPYFSIRHYLTANQDVAQSSYNPLVHYILFGEAEGRQPVPLRGPKKFNLSEEQIKTLTRRYFDAEFYLNANPDVAAGNIDPFSHFMHGGWRENRDPSPYFSSQYYIDFNPDVAAAGINPLRHYIMQGSLEGRSARPTLSETFGFGFDFQSDRQVFHLPVAGDAKLTSDAPIVVHLHCFYLDVFEALLPQLARISGTARLLVSVDSPEKAEAATALMQQAGLGQVEIFEVPNRGRDLAPMLIDLRKKLKGDEIVLHIHTKKSKEKEEFGALWFRDLCRHVLFNASYVAHVVSLFEADTSLGVAMPRPYPGIRPYMVWGNNAKIAKWLIHEVGALPNILGQRHLDFPAGDFLWFRADALDWVERINLTYGMFPEEPIPDDGSLAHALERLLAHFVEHQGRGVCHIAPLPYHLNWPKQSQPLVSVIIPCLNAMPWLPHAVQSCLMQSLGSVPVEVIVVDNGSTDGSLAYVKTLEALYGNVVVLHEKTKGAGAARNAGLDAALGEYVMFLDADDVLMPSAITELVDAMRDPEKTADFVTSSLTMFSENLSGAAVPYGNDGAVRVLTNTITNDNVALWEVLLEDFGPCAKLYKKAYLDKIDARFPTGISFEDNYFVAKTAISASKITLLSRSTYLYRKHLTECGKTQSTSLKVGDMRDQIAVSELIAKDLDLSRMSTIRQILLKSILTKIAQEAQRLGATDAVLTEIARSDLLIDLIRKTRFEHILTPIWNRIVTLREGL